MIKSFLFVAVKQNWSIIFITKLF